MRSLQRKPTSPGELLYEEFLVPLGITQKELADHLRVDYKVINRIVNEKARITPEMAIKLAQALETTPHFWLNSQQALDIWSSEQKKGKIPSLMSKRHRRHLSHSRCSSSR